MTDWTDAFISKKYKKLYKLANEGKEVIYRFKKGTKDDLGGAFEVDKASKIIKKTETPAAKTNKPSLMDRTLKDRAWHGGKKTKPKDKTTKQKSSGSTVWSRAETTDLDKQKAGKGNIVSIKNTKDTNSLKIETPDLKIVKTTPKPKSKAGRPKKVDPNANPISEGLGFGFTSSKVLAGREKRAAKKKATGNIYGNPLKRDVVTVKGGAKRGDISKGRPSTDMQRYDKTTGKPLREGLTIGRGEPMYRGTKPKKIAGQPSKLNRRRR
tara:strand:+ start:525 stop:1325 length:801 start_codon:yes stop_codon:yes gene_type:complete